MEILIAFIIVLGALMGVIFFGLCVNLFLKDRNLSKEKWRVDNE